VDSGYELRQPINYIRQRVNNEGYFCTGMGDSLTRGGRPGMFAHFNTTLETFLGRPMTAGGVHGGTYWGGAYNGVVKYDNMKPFLEIILKIAKGLSIFADIFFVCRPAVECALNEACLTPPAGTNMTYSYIRSLNQQLKSLMKRLYL